MAVAVVVYLAAEVAAIWAVASAVGALWTIALLVGGALVGSWLARREGGKAMRAAMRTAQAGGSPHREVTDGMLVALGGVLILLPGFVSDALGLFVLFPPTRRLVHKAWMRRVERRTPTVAYGPEPRDPRRRDDSDRGVIIEGEVVDEGPATGRA